MPIHRTCRLKQAHVDSSKAHPLSIRMCSSIANTQWTCLDTAGAKEWRESAGGEFEKARVQLERGEWLTANQFLADVLDFDKVLCVCVCV